MGKPNKPLTQEEEAFILENYRGTSHKRMAELLQERSGLKRSKAQVQKFYRHHSLESGLDTKFTKGHASWNRGRPMNEWASPESIEKIRKGQFRKGHIGDNARLLKPIGHRSVRRNGYVWVKIGQPNLWKEEHRLVWEEAYGPLPRRQKLLHIDGNRANNSLDNLILISDEEMTVINRWIGLTDSREINMAAINIARVRKKINEVKGKR